MAKSNTTIMDTEIPNGPGAAAILAAGVGCAALGVFALLGDAIPRIATFFIFYSPVGPLSGVTLCALLVWLATWWTLARLWGEKNVAVGRVIGIAFALLALGFALTFPPIMDILQGK